MFLRVFATIGALGFLNLPLGAQELTNPDKMDMDSHRAIVFFVHGGSESALKDFNTEGTADFETGFNLGGGIGLNIQRNLALRADFTFARNKVSAPGMDLNDQDFNRYIFGGDLMLMIPVVRDRVAPYVFSGIGSVTVDPDFATELMGDEPERFTNVAGRIGAGVQFDFPGTELGLFAEALGLLYQFDEIGFDKTQFDVLGTIGLSWAMPLH